MFQMQVIGNNGRIQGKAETGDAAERVSRMSNKGFMTIEACVIVPVLLSCCFFVLALLLQFFRRDALQLAAIRHIYTLTLSAEEEKMLGAELENKLLADGARSGEIPGRAEVSVEEEAAKVISLGRVHLISDDTVTVTKEVRCCTDRLRRWQLYDDITER